VPDATTIGGVPPQTLIELTRRRADSKEEIAVNARTMFIMALGASMALSTAGRAQQQPGAYLPLPAASQPANPELAQRVAAVLSQSSQLTGCRVQVFAFGNVVDLRGEVADESQRMAIIHLARSTPGIVAVRDWMQTMPDQAVAPAQAPLLQPLPLPQPQLLDKKGPPARIDGPLPEPMPIFQPMPGPNPTMQPPPLPPYAWPTVAPYNNYSRVAYPLAQPYEQWPFIGPMYPFPRVPLGWRSVSLTWADGCWWYHRNPTGHDWWRIRYW
jgi:BON domain-containing protein